jgi:hypothetical protein
VIQVADGARGVSVYPDIFTNTYYGPEINFCKRFWSAGKGSEAGQEGGSAPPGEATGAIVGGALAAVAVVAVVVVVVVVCTRRRKEDKRDPTMAPLAL